MSEVEETLNRIKTSVGVQGVVILSADGMPIRSTIADIAFTATLAEQGLRLVTECRHHVRTMDKDNDATFIRIRAGEKEYLIAIDASFILIVIQDHESN